MGSAIFWGVFAAVTVCITVIVLVVRRKIRRFSRQYLGTENILEALSEENLEDTPKSVSGLDTLLLPQILKDFPDFDVSQVKSFVRDYIRRALKEKSGLSIHNVVISRYLPTQAQKTILFQAAVSYEEDGHTVQTRYEVHYSYILGDGTASVAANCPNCGGAMGFGETVCRYCGTRVANVLKNSWKFTELREI